MKKLYKFLGLLVLGVIIFFAGRLSNTSDQKIKIVKETKTIYKIKRIPITQQDFVNCFNSQINILGIMQDDWLHVIAGDECKQAKKSYKLKVDKKNFAGIVGIQVGAGLNHSLQPSFYIGVGFTYGLVLF